jgi:hypothetical protein
MELSDSDFIEEENDITQPTTFETNEESTKETHQKANYKKWIDSKSDISNISNMVNSDIESSTDKESINEEKEEKEENNNVEENEEDNESKDAKEDSNNIKINYLFIWTEGGSQVKLTGSFSDWKIKFDMAKDPNDNCFKCQLPLDNKIYQFKFIVDNDWKCSDKYPKKEDNSGNINNFIDLTDYKENKNKTPEKKEQRTEKEKDNENTDIKEPENNKEKNKIKRKGSIYSSQYPSNDSIIPLPLPNKRYYQSFKLDKFSHQNNIGNKKYYKYYQRYSFSDEKSSKPIFLLGHVNLNHLISSKNKRMIKIKNCMSFRFREKACTFIYYK